MSVVLSRLDGDNKEFAVAPGRPVAYAERYDGCCCGCSIGGGCVVAGYTDRIATVEGDESLGGDGDVLEGTTSDRRLSKLSAAAHSLRFIMVYFTAFQEKCVAFV